ncbi:preprotein translocase subunit SecA [Lactococcus garvieae]|uniref:Protein translocase subunit SecA n=1 Tax=Lactococcus garvieae DCC43 TaxID=1231377 RepID=K2QEE1_9LACT|nr:preprotein translocase subunit SecA [Lactococcus garvieae]EKF51787.1 Protein export cytoplasm protein SecA2 ATPase RNA helicase [Lactococcus garvieae DCC43]
MHYKKILKKINGQKESFKQKSDEELQTEVFLLKKEIRLGTHEEKILIKAFALVREADYRVIGLFPTDEQVLGALVLYDGKIAEMKTGEGKSLVATMPLFLKTLYLKQAFLITTNDYLAQRDYERIGPVLKWLGLTVVAGVNDPEEKEFNHAKRKTIYAADIVYTSSSTLGFDYLINGLAAREEERFMPDFRYALLDEVDEILLDSAQTPLIISGNPKVQSNYFELADQLISTLEENIHYKLDEERKNVWLTEQGIVNAKDYLALQELLDDKYFAIYQHLILALKAHKIYKKERDYLVENDKVKLLDRKDGRILEGTNLQNGLHQAIQAKEGVELTPETQTLSSITYQNLFRQFNQLAGMSGTAKVAEEEFIATYNLSVKKIKTHKKAIRKDHKPMQYVTFNAKVEAVLSKIKSLYLLERPILVITGSVASSELFSMHLLNLGIPHNILNAKSGVKEARIIQEAGKKGAVTISTTMAGRGTDIKIDPEAISLGGLAVVLTERMLNQRIELQAKGRAGRQGEPGETYAFESLEDDVIRYFSKEAVQAYYNRKKNSVKPIKRRRIKKVFNNAQKLSEDKAYSERINALQFDEVLKLQKQAVDKSRKQVMTLETSKEALALFYEKSEIAITQFIEEKGYEKKILQRYILDNIDYNFKYKNFTEEIKTNEEAKEFILNCLKNNLEVKQKLLNDEQGFLQYLKLSILKSIDVSWSHQVNLLNQLRFAVQPRTVAQKKAIIEYEKEAQRSFNDSKNKLTALVLRNVALSMFEIKKGELIVTFP